ncbi:MAG: alpha/beta hydrolase [Chloroflexi bacterium]|nr:alpha/beta hydrolase [Chloroflexota bacterium]MCY3696612.1 alpha/beta hydrolase [Chloroflexota bacterium]
MPKTLEVTGATLSYDEFGDGPKTIVFVHDAGGNHLSWWNQIPWFQDRFRCVTYEVRGWGQSQDLSGEDSTAFSRDLGELMDQLEIDRAALVGQSMGGFTVLPYAVHNPDRVAALMMADTVVGIGDAAILAGLQDSLEAAGSATPEEWETQMFGSAYVERSPEGVFLYNQIRALNSPPESFAGYGVEQGAVTSDELTNLKMPVVFVAGSEDVLIPGSLVRQAAELIPHAKYVEVATCGHSVYWELPERFNAILEELLAEAYG